MKHWTATRSQTSDWPAKTSLVGVILLLLCHLSPRPSSGLQAASWSFRADLDSISNAINNTIKSATPLVGSVAASLGFGCSTPMSDPFGSPDSSARARAASSAVEPDFLVVATNKRQVQRLPALTSSEQAILAAGFDPRKSATTLLIPGWQQRPTSSGWTGQVEAQFRSSGLSGRENLLVLDYSRVSRRDYQYASGAARAVGQVGARFLARLVERLGVAPSSIRLVGGSLGAHVAGFMARELTHLLGAGRKVGVVVALDPAGPCFESRRDRLRASDAQQVYVYHFDSHLLGSRDLLGTRDVYFNGGASQPGAGTRVGGLNHLRAFAVAAAEGGRDQHCQLVAYECSSWSSFKAGNCGQCGPRNERCHLATFNWQLPGGVAERTTRSHLDGPASSRRMFVATSGRAPFCRHHWQVLVELRDDTDSSTVQVELQFEGAPSGSVQMDRRARAGRKSALLLTDGRASRVVGARTSKQVRSVQVNYLSNIDARVRSSLSSRLCRVEGSTGSFELCEMSK